MCKVKTYYELQREKARIEREMKELQPELIADMELNGIDKMMSDDGSCYIKLIRCNGGHKEYDYDAYSYIRAY